MRAETTLPRQSVARSSGEPAARREGENSLRPDPRARARRDRGKRPRRPPCPISNRVPNAAVAPNARPVRWVEEPWDTAARDARARSYHGTAQGHPIRLSQLRCVNQPRPRPRLSPPPRGRCRGAPRAAGEAPYGAPRSTGGWLRMRSTGWLRGGLVPLLLCGPLRERATSDEQAMRDDS